MYVVVTDISVYKLTVELVLVCNQATQVDSAWPSLCSKYQQKLGHTQAQCVMVWQCKLVFS